MKQWDKGQQVIFEANPDYYGEQPKIKKVTVLFMEEDAALAAARQAGRCAHTAASYADQKLNGYSAFEVESVDNRGFNLPCSEEETRDGIVYGNAFTADVNVRRAINIGIDREEMIEHVLNGYGTEAYSVCDQMPWYNEKSAVSYDPEQAETIHTQDGTGHEEKHHHHHHEHRGLGDIFPIIDRCEMTDTAKELAKHIFRILAKAEAKAHNVPENQVHFHEVGAVDSIVDIVAAAVCMDSLQVDGVIVPFLCEGKGTVRCQHGILPVPVPAVTNIVQNSGLKLRMAQVEGDW